MAPMTQPIVQSSVGCWQGFVNGAKSVGSWCATQAGALWQVIKKAAIWAAGFFSALGAGIVMFARLYARELIIGGIGLALGIVIALVLARCLGCCNKPPEEPTNP